MKYFFDNCISFRYARMLSALDVDVVAVRDVFDPSTPDIEIFQSFHGKELVFVTADMSQATRSHEARALRECGVTALFFGPFWPRMEQWRQASWLLSKWPTISAFAESVTLGTCAEIKQNGKAMPFVL